MAKDSSEYRVIKENNKVWESCIVNVWEGSAVAEAASSDISKPEVRRAGPSGFKSEMFVDWLVPRL